MVTRREVLAASIAAATGRSRPTEEMIVATAKEMFRVGVGAAKSGETVDVEGKWIEWEDADDGHIAGWVALAKWHLGVR